MHLMTWTVLITFNKQSFKYNFIVPPNILYSSTLDLYPVIWQLFKIMTQKRELMTWIWNLDNQTLFLIMCLNFRHSVTQPCLWSFAVTWQHFMKVLLKTGTSKPLITLKLPHSLNNHHKKIRKIRLVTFYDHYDV